MRGWHFDRAACEGILAFLSLAIGDSFFPSTKKGEGRKTTAALLIVGIICRLMSDLLMLT